MLAETNIFLANAVSGVPGKALVDPLLVPFLIRSRQDKEFDLHLLEFPGAECKIPRRDLIPKRLTDLRDSEGQLLPRSLKDVVEIDKDSLGRLGPEISLCCRLF